MTHLIFETEGEHLSPWFCYHFKKSNTFCEHYLVYAQKHSTLIYTLHHQLPRPLKKPTEGIRPASVQGPVLVQVGLKPALPFTAADSKRRDPDPLPCHSTQVQKCKPSLSLKQALSSSVLMLQLFLRPKCRRQYTVYSTLSSAKPILSRGCYWFAIYKHITFQQLKSEYQQGKNFTRDKVLGSKVFRVFNR